MEKKIVTYKCENCFDGIVNKHISISKTSGEIVVKKCTKCRYQYSIKGLSGLIKHEKL